MGDSEENCEKNSRECEMEEFRQNLREKREQRQTVLAKFREKFSKLKSENAQLKELCEKSGIKVEFEESQSADSAPDDDIDDDSDHQHRDDDDDHVTNLKSNLAEAQYELQLANANVLTLTSELSAVKRQVVSLKEVNTISKQLIGIREAEMNQLRAKLRDIEESIADREMLIMSENLRNEYNRQLDNMKNLKSLYEQRARLADLEIETLKERLIASENRLKEEVDKNQNQQNHIQKVDNELSMAQNQLDESRCEIEKLQTEYGTINQLFCRMLIGFNSGNDNLDIDRLAEILEEHRLLLSDITNNEESLIANNFLPKVLCDLVTQATDRDNGGGADDDSEVDKREDENSLINRREISTTEEIIGNLPKVWRILTELLSHQKKINPVPLEENGQNDDCYKSVETPSGPQLVLSVSKTYIKLKNLIVEKKSLQKETNRLKTLNCHLERTLQSQEKRLGVVSVELTKTWHLVNRLQRQHRQLHTQEQVLRYQLQQKRRLLVELKEELEYCRQKWAKAREKNEDSEMKWELLRREFAARKDGSASAESGYSDDPVSEEEDEENQGFEKTPDTLSEDEVIGAEKETVNETKTPARSETLEEMFNRISASVQDNPQGDISESDAPPPPPLPPPPATLASNENVRVDLANSIPSTSRSGALLTENEEEYTARRAARLKRLEEECKTFMVKMSVNREKGSQLSHQLDQVHTRFGEGENNPGESSTSQSETIEEDSPTTSTNPTGLLTATEKDYTSRRSERIQRLEVQFRELMDKMTANKNRGEELSEQLDGMHQRFSSSSRSSSEAPSSTENTPKDVDDEGDEEDEESGENAA
ncbi:hypothetical protein DMENIID0001_002270 [Sergentomyia squamirostris]